MTALVTGDTSGIGLELKRQLKLYTDHTVYGFGHTKCDLRKPKEIKEYVKKLPKLDIIFCNAGIYITKPFRKHTLKDWNETFAVNVTGHYVLLHELVTKNKLGEKPLLIFISSDMLFRMPANQIAYNCSKGALEVLGLSIIPEIPHSSYFLFRLPFVHTKQSSVLNPADPLPDKPLWPDEVAHNILKEIGVII